MFWWIRSIVLQLSPIVTTLGQNNICITAVAAQKHTRNNFISDYFSYLICSMSTGQSQHCLPLVWQNIYNLFSKHQCKTCRCTAHWSCVNETNKRQPQGVLTQTGPQTVMPKSYKLLCCLNKAHINLSSVIFLWRSPTLKCFHLTFI